MYAVVYPAMESPKKIGPPETAEPALCVVTNAGIVDDNGEVGLAVAGARGKVSKDKVLKHEARMSEKESARIGSWVEV